MSWSWASKGPTVPCVLHRLPPNVVLCGHTLHGSRPHFAHQRSVDTVQIVYFGTELTAGAETHFFTTMSQPFVRWGGSALRVTRAISCTHSARRALVNLSNIRRATVFPVCSLSVPTLRIESLDCRVELDEHPLQHIEQIRRYGALWERSEEHTSELQSR